jgi:RNA polymerase sigma factor (sigma-70 family)
MTSPSSTPQPSVLKTQGFDAFYREYHPRVVVYFLYRQRELAWDLAADTFLGVFKSLETFRGSSIQQELAWLWAIARNHLSGYIGTKQAERAALQRLGPPATSNDAAFDRVEETYDAERLASKLLDELDMPLHRQALKMHFEEGLDYATMGKILDETPAAMRKRVNDGLRYLRRILDIPEN